MDVMLDVRAGGAAVLCLRGRLDLLSAGEAKQQMIAAVAGGHRRLVVDLGSVSFVDSSGLGALVGGLKATRTAGGDLRIARPSLQTRSVLKLTMLERVLRPYETVEEALAEF